jgi:D-lactate dehydrogenase (cytochrome)
MLIKDDPTIIAGYLEDASGFTQGCATRVVIPENEKEIAEYLQAASQRKETITISGGRTGVAAGCIPQQGTILSLELFDHLGAIEKTPEGGSIRIQPGVRLDTLKAAVLSAGLLYGPDPTERTGTLGGNAATNASGGQCFKYGTTREHILGLSMILSTGEKLHLERGQSLCKNDLLRFPLNSGRILECQRPLLPKLQVTKNAAGYFSAPDMDALDLLIGMDGTLGIITEINLRLIPAPAGIFSLVLFFPSQATALDCAARIRSSSQRQKTIAGITPASLEFMDIHSLDLLKPDFPNIPAESQAALLIEQEHTLESEEAALTHWFNFCTDLNILENMIWFAQTKKDREHIRTFRHALPEAVNTIVRKRKFRKVGTDMAVPESEFPAMFDIYTQGLSASGLEHLIFGHIGECHLHVNVLPNTQAEFDQAKALYLNFAQQAVQRGGTVSAEHGIGKIKHDFFQLMVGEQGFQEMARVKRCFDPTMILNRNNIFPEHFLDAPA